ncbi:MAG TPA: hypothetical protein VIB48_12455 [Acidimicrobiia bacterium]
MQLTLENLTSPRVHRDGLESAATWLAGRRVWERRLAELEARPRLRRVGA